MASRIGEAAETLAQSSCDLVGLPARVLRTRPEEPAQAVAARARHDVDMEMRDALTDDVVVGHEGSLRAQHDGKLPTDVLDAPPERADTFDVEIGERDHMVPRYHERVPVHEWRSI